MEKYFLESLGIKLEIDEIIIFEKKLNDFLELFNQYLHNLDQNLETIPQDFFPYINKDNIYMKQDNETNKNTKLIEQSANFKNGYFIIKNKF